MSPKKQLAIFFMVLVLVVMIALACRIGPVWIGPGEPTPFTGIDPVYLETARAAITPVPTPDCGGTVTGDWSGHAGDGNERVTYTMHLVQTGCKVTGSSVSEGSVTSTVKGIVDQGNFHFVESGSGNNCYWKGILTLLTDTWLSGKVENCSRKSIELYKK